MLASIYENLRIHVYPLALTHHSLALLKLKSAASHAVLIHDIHRTCRMYMMYRGRIHWDLLVPLKRHTVWRLTSLWIDVKLGKVPKLLSIPYLSPATALYSAIHWHRTAYVRIHNTYDYDTMDYMTKTNSKYIILLALLDPFKANVTTSRANQEWPMIYLKRAYYLITWHTIPRISYSPRSPSGI